jgi:hypothetical protein
MRNAVFLTLFLFSTMCCIEKPEILLSQVKKIIKKKLVKTVIYSAGLPFLMLFLGYITKKNHDKIIMIGSNPIKSFYSKASHLLLNLKQSIKQYDNTFIDWPIVLQRYFLIFLFALPFFYHAISSSENES